MDLLDAWLPWVLVPALVLSLAAQLFVQFVLVRSESKAARMSGYAVARHVLDGSARYDIPVEQVPGPLSDHFDAHRRTLQLSDEVYHGRTEASLAIAAHEASHALQYQRRNPLLVVRDLAVPAASFASGGGILLAIVGLLGRFPPLLALGILMFSVTLYLQLLNVPIELHASRLARRRLVALGIVQPDELPAIRTALLAVALLYVGATLQSLFVLARRAAWRLTRPRGQR